MFVHDLIELDSLERIDTPEGRSYRISSGVSYPSVTTVLSKTKDMSGLDAWRKRIGNEAADLVLRAAGNRGTNMHLLCEKLINNEEIDLRREMPVSKQLFLQLRPYLEKHVNNIRGIELPLYSDYLKVAGTADLIAEWDGQLAIIDYKSSKKPKKPEWITDYWIQTAIYAIAFEERTGIPINKLVILMGVEESTKPEVFIGTRKEWQNQAIARIEQFYC